MTTLTRQQLNDQEMLLDELERSARIRARWHLPEPADDGDTTEVDDLISSMGVAELEDIAAARERLSARQYGICTNCGCNIDYARLQAYPTAKRCTSCQHVHEEKTHKKPLNIINCRSTPPGRST